jgi:hypothetical protein
MYRQLRKYSMTNEKELTIVCNCDEKEQMDMSVHIVHGIVPIILVKCEACTSVYKVIPNSVRDA